MYSDNPDGKFRDDPFIEIPLTISNNMKES